MLRSGRGFVEPHPVFDDVTGDGKADALVRVMTGGAASAVAVYVLSTDGTKSSDLRVVMRNQRLYRATLKVNSQGTWNLLELALAKNARFLMASTSETYGDPSVHPQREDSVRGRPSDGCDLPHL